MKTGIYIGRFQPFHDGHKACIDEILKECGHVLVLIRDGEKNEKNPYTFEERVAMISNQYSDNNCVQIMRIDDRSHDLTVYKGREVGWDIKDIKLSPEIEAISATKIRKEIGL